ncbi:hypothetical protein Tco_0083099, partial [Tanacetum coccineum]
MLKVACLPSHPLEMLVARKKRRGSEAVYEALLLPRVMSLGKRGAGTDGVRAGGARADGAGAGGAGVGGAGLAAPEIT